MKIVLVLLTSLTFVVCSRIECDWESQFLCGDKCLGIQNTCYCGSYSIPYNQTNAYYCCQEPNTSCETWNGNVLCQGEPLVWNQQCHGSCTQEARRGETLLPCDDKSGCYLLSFACIGEPLCTE